MSPAWLRKLEQATGRSLGQAEPAREAPRQPNPADDLSPQEAIVGFMLCVFGIKDGITDEKVQYLTLLSNHHRLFWGMPSEEFEGALARMVQLFNQLGSAALIDECAAHVPRPLKPTVFALALDIVFVTEGYLHTDYQPMMEHLQDVLGIPENVANPIGNVLGIKAGVFDPGEGAEF